MIQAMGRLLAQLFLSTLSLRRATPKWTPSKCRDKQFLSTLSLRRATFRGWTLNINGPIFLSTLSLRRATRGHRSNDRCPVHFYPRSPCGERQTLVPRRNQKNLFLSTLSLRRATPRGGPCYLDNIISIHALLAESDGKSNKLAGLELVFLSTLSLRRATTTDMRQRLIEFRFLSTLSLRRATMILPRSCNVRSNFYPRSPCGERLLTHIIGFSVGVFLSTLSLRRATGRGIRRYLAT